MAFDLTDLVTMLQLGVLASIAVYLLQVGAVMHHLRQRPLAPIACEPVSILKPLCGNFEGLRENLESFAQLRYPRCEILLGCKDEHDSALPVARDFQRCHPELPIRIVIDKRETRLSRGTVRARGGQRQSALAAEEVPQPPRALG